MNIGFRKSLFGFNCDDVMSYVEKTHKAFTEKEIVLKEQIEEISNECNDYKSQLGDAMEKIASLEAQLKEYTDKYDEIERLSQNIGKLYLVAKSNSDAIIKDAQENADIMRREVQKNVSYIGDAHESLSGVKEDVLNSSARFAKELDDLMSSLDSAKDKIFKNDEDTQKSVEEYRELIRSLSNE